jgi:uncharacterized iron-regulated protein
MKRMTEVMRYGAALWAALIPFMALAEIPQAARDAQIVVLGEQHDNPAHHIRQAEWTAALAPAAVVFEMLTPAQAARVADGWADQADFDALTGWSQTGWPSLDMYYPIFSAAPDATIYGAGVTREQIAEQLGSPLTSHPLAGAYGLDILPDPAEQAAREALQARAHCDALPEEMLPMMVDAQRLRDLVLADAALRALRDTGGPVVVITGNGHARADWGMPALLANAAPDVAVFAVAQGEDGAEVHGVFALSLDAPAPERGDPCAAFTR